ncbi:MAG: hypothetical protein IKE00_02425 [Oscillospiraceae bacterium]|nr:hypothetical protein [Oscillospiraceae bacterium]
MMNNRLKEGFANQGKYIIVAILVLVFSFLTGCSISSTSASNPKTVEQLREEYGYFDEQGTFSNSIPNELVYPTFETLMGINNKYGITRDFYAVVSIEICSDWYEISKRERPFNEDSINEQIIEATPSITQIVWPVVDAKVVDVLWGSNDLKKDDIITLGFGSKTYISGMQLEKVYKQGEKLVCFLVENDFGYANMYSTGRLYTYFLTEDDIVMSVTSTPGADECSGMSLDAFVQKFSELLDGKQE